MSKKSKFKAGLILGAVSGALAGLFLAPKAGKELRKDAQKLYDDISADPEAAVKAIFGKVSDEGVAMYKSAQKELVKQLTNLSENYKTLDSSKYKEVVVQAINNVKTEKKLPDNQLKTLMDYLEKDIKKLASGSKSTKAGMKDGSKDAVKKTTKKSATSS